MRTLKRSVAFLLMLGAVAGTAIARPGDAKDDVVKKIAAAIPEKAPATPKKPRKVLLFSKTNGYRHASIPVAVRALTMLGEKTGAFTAVHSEDDAMFEADKLNDFDALIMVNPSKEIFRPKRDPKDVKELKKVQARERRLQENLVAFVSGGKGLAGVHSATDTYKKWKKYNDMMGGAFDNHPWHEEVPIKNLEPGHPVNAAFDGAGFRVTDEIYQFREGTARKTDRRMLLCLDADKMDLSKGKRADKFYPISWIAKYGRGRTFYCSLGHRDEIYWNPAVLRHYLAGIQFALGDLNADASPTGK